MDIFTSAILDSVCYFLLISLLEMNITRKPVKKKKKKKKEPRAFANVILTRILCSYEAEWYCNHVFLI